MKIISGGKKDYYDYLVSKFGNYSVNKKNNKKY